MTVYVFFCARKHSNDNFSRQNWILIYFPEIRAILFLAEFSLVAFGGLCAPKMVVPTMSSNIRKKALGAIYACTDSEMVHIRLAGLL